MFGPLNLGMSVPEAKKAATDALEAVGADDIGQKLPSYLSGGQKRLVSIAGILAMKPRVIALDEPTSDLDVVHAGIIEGIIRDLRDKHGISVVIATHDLDMAARLADRICVVKKGSIVAEGTPADIFYDLSILDEAGLKKPDIVRIYESLCKSMCLAPEDRPVNTDELVRCISIKAKK
jgi:cobalt/nickel transport system ATP-binding protein